YSCEQCTEQLWDLLFGLLDAEAAQALRDHLAGCPACRAAFAEAQGQQDLVTRAARLYDQVPPFSAPSDEAVTAAAPQPEAPAVAGSIAPAVPSPRRASRRWPWWAAAAALLLTVAGAYAWYQRGLRPYEQALAAREKDHADRLADLGRLRQLVR